jgi:hypothetical protein
MKLQVAAITYQNVRLVDVTFAPVANRFAESIAVALQEWLGDRRCCG